MVPTFKICLFGAPGTGKTTYLKRISTGEYEKKYVATLGVEVHPLTFHTTKGPITFNVWDCAGQEKFGGLRDSYYLNSDLGICFLYTNDPALDGQTISLFKEKCGSEVIGVWSMCDLEERKKIPAHLQGNVIKHSTRNNYNLDTPFLQASKILLQDPDLQFVEAPAIRPPLVTDYEVKAN